MTTQSNTSQLTIRLVFLAEEQNLTDIALVNEVGREVFNYLRAQGYNIEPYDDTGAMVPLPIFDLYKFIHDNPELAMALLNETVTLLKPILTTICKRKKLRHTIKSSDGVSGSNADAITSNDTTSNQDLDRSYYSQVSHYRNGQQETITITIKRDKDDSHL